MVLLKRVKLACGDGVWFESLTLSFSTVTPCALSLSPHCFLSHAQNRDRRLVSPDVSGGWLCFFRDCVILHGHYI